MLLNVLIYSIQIGKYFPIFSEILRKFTKSFFSFRNAIFHNKILLNTIRLELLENLPNFRICNIDVRLRMFNDILQMLYSMS